MSKFRPAFVLASTLFLPLAASAEGPSASAPAAAAAPVAARKAHETVLHGTTLKDDWFWLRERENPEVKKYLEAENAYSEAWMADAKDLRTRLYDEMLGRIKQTDLSVPWAYKGWLWYTRTETGKQYPIWCRRKDASSPEQIVLDVNELAKGERFMNVGSFTPNPDATLLAYRKDNTGFRDYVLAIRDLKTGKDLADTAPRVTSLAWANDGRTLLYTTTDPAKRSYRLWRHVVGGEKDDLVYEEKDERFNIGVYRSRDEGWLVLEVGSHTSGEVRLVPSGDPKAEPKLVAARKPDVEYDVEPRGDVLYVRSNEGCRNFRILTAPAKDPRPETWKELVPCRDAVMVEGVFAFKRHVVFAEREDALPQISVTDVASGARHRIAQPEAIYSAFPDANREFDTAKFRYTFNSFTTPATVFDYDMATKERTLLKKTEVLGGFDPTAYVSERRYATAADGVRVPISLVYRKTTKLDGTAPIYLTAYGSYGAPSNVGFNYSRPTLLDRGFVWALAHIRGGGDLGKKWHDDGRMLKKKNTFTDFIASAEALVAQKVGAKDKIVIEGGSAGGLLMGAVTNMRPDLWAGVLAQVPFVDVINSMVDDTLPLTVAEFEEWGNPKAKKDEFEYMLSYSPYDNVRKGPYPPLLVKTSFDDSQVMYWEPAKYVAKLRASKTDSNPLLFVCNMAGGHGGSSGRYDRLKEIAFDYAWALKVLGLDKPKVELPKAM